MPDTIAACSSGSMPCGIAVLRLSGPKALAITDGLFFPRTGGPLSTREPRKLVYGRLLARDGALLDLCLACRYSPKHSYTGEDLVEFFTHGSQAVAAGLCFAVMLLLYFMNSLAGFLSDSDSLLCTVMESLSVFERFYTFVNGVFDLTAVLYFGSIIGVCLFVTVQMMEKRRWNG